MEKTCFKKSSDTVPLNKITVLHLWDVVADPQVIQTFPGSENRRTHVKSRQN